jgi:hypothetical protein
MKLYLAIESTRRKKSLGQSSSAVCKSVRKSHHRRSRLRQFDDRQILATSFSVRCGRRDLRALTKKSAEINRPNFARSSGKIDTELKSNFARPASTTSQEISGIRCIDSAQNSCQFCALAKPQGGCRRDLIFEKHGDARSTAIRIQFSNHTLQLQQIRSCRIDQPARSMLPEVWPNSRFRRIIARRQVRT